MCWHQKTMNGPIHLMCYLRWEPLWCDFVPGTLKLNTRCIWKILCRSAIDCKNFPFQRDVSFMSRIICFTMIKSLLWHLCLYSLHTEANMLFNHVKVCSLEIVSYIKFLYCCLLACNRYLMKEKKRGKALDSVANFHLQNGAVCQAIHILHTQLLLCFIFQWIKFRYLHQTTNPSFLVLWVNKREDFWQRLRDLWFRS